PPATSCRRVKSSCAVGTACVGARAAASSSKRSSSRLAAIFDHRLVAQLSQPGQGARLGRSHRAGPFAQDRGGLLRAQAANDAQLNKFLVRWTESRKGSAKIGRPFSTEDQVQRTGFTAGIVVHLGQRRHTSPTR